MNLAFLKQKKWGLPIWAWAAITAVVLAGAYYYYKKKSGSSASSTSPDTSTADSSQLPLSTLPYDYGSGGGGDSGFGGSGDYNGYSPPVAPMQEPLVIELQQPGGTGSLVDVGPSQTGPAVVTHTTPPASPSVSLANALQSTLSTTSLKGAVAIPKVDLGTVQNESKAPTTQAALLAAAQAVKPTVQPPVKTVSTKTLPNAYTNPKTKANIH